MTRSHRLAHAILGAWLGILAPMAGHSRRSRRSHSRQAEIKRPAYEVRLSAEDWSAPSWLRPRETDDSGTVEVHPLNRDGSVDLTLAGQVRERLEYFNEFQFDRRSRPSPTPICCHGSCSARTACDALFRAVCRGEDPLATDRDLQGGDRNAFVDTIDLQNAFADVMVPLGDGASFMLRAAPGASRRPAPRGPLDWSNVRRTFDGASGILKLRDWTVTPFWTVLATVREHQFE